jgi:hypothetical protein
MIISFYILTLYAGCFYSVCRYREKGKMMRKTTRMIGFIAGMRGFVAGSVLMLTVSIGFASDMAAQLQVAAPPPPSQKEPFSATSGLGIIGRWSGSLEGDGRMEIDPTLTGFKIILRVSDPSGCIGFFESTGPLSGDTITLTKGKNERVCTIAIKFKAWDVAEVSENNCSEYHGTACGFHGTLKRED